MKNNQKITVGIPAYNRPETLYRALKSLENQIYTDFRVIVIDDCSPSCDLSTVVNRYKNTLNIDFIRNTENKGLVKNCLNILEIVNTEYFMWMADDDEYSESYLYSLIQILDDDATVSTAAGHWHLLIDEQTKITMATASFEDQCKLLRMVRYMWGSDDAFFYGLHRTSIIKKVFFNNFWWPNKDTVFNWCYVPLFQIVLSGRVVLTKDTSSVFINHQYTEKDYFSDPGGRVISAIKWCIRRVNIYYYYLLIVIRGRAWTLLIPATLVVLACILRDVSSRIFRSFFQRGKPIRTPIS